MSMLGSLAFLLLFGWLAGKLAALLRLPPLLGMLFVGVLAGPYVFNVFAPELLHISQDLRSFALIIILLRAGLGLKRESLTQVGGPAFKISLLPCLLEGFTVMIVSQFMLDLHWTEAGMLGFILAAVSPAVVIPAMLDLKEKGYGEDKQIPTLILAGATIDDVFAITLFTTFLGLGTQGYTSLLAEIVSIPFNIGAGILGGLLIAVTLLKIYDLPALYFRYTEKLLLLLTCAALYFTAGERLGIASLLGIMTIGFVLLEKRAPSAARFANTMTHIWLFAQIVLFTLVGAEVNIGVALQAGLTGAAVLTIGLISRSLGVWLATAGTRLTGKERLFCIIAYTPKATVQAAIGALPLAAGVPAGHTILAIAVLSVVLTAPLGAMGIQFSAPRLLNKVEITK